jgi:thiamine pyrophosphate-dependent acetolactate synthase large subunit-like protein
MPADQFVCTEFVLEETPDAVCVSNLGVASYVLAAVAPDRDRNCYQWGSMGVTTPVGLGLSLATDDPVTVLDGDGSILMSLGALATLAAEAPPTLTLVVWRNEVYGTTGGQPTHAADLAAAARACGLRADHVDTDADFAEAYADAVAAPEPAVVVCDVEPVDPDARPPFDYVEVVNRVRRALS